MKVLVTGGSGILGRSICSELLALGMDVVSASRNGGGETEHPKLSSIAFDFECAESYKPTFLGIDMIVLLPPPMDKDSECKVIPFVEAAADFGIRKFIFVSHYGIEQIPASGVHLIGDYFRNSNLSYSIVRPNFLMDNFTEGYAKDFFHGDTAFYLTNDNGAISFISGSDVAKFIGKVSLDFKSHIGKVYELTGGESKDFDEVLEVMSSYVKGEVKNIRLSPIELKKEIIEKGFPSELADIILIVLGISALGLLSKVSPDFKRITNEDPMKFKDFLDQYYSTSLSKDIELSMKK